jgi:predicted HTH domain antitoxin
MHTLTFQIPDSVSERDARMILASQLYSRAVLSLGQAADLAGVAKRQFIESLGKYGVNLFNYTSEEMDHEFGAES